METLISLSEAFRRMLEIEDRALGVKHHSDPLCFSGPTDAQIAKILSRMPEVTVYGDRRRTGRIGDITHVPEGGSGEVFETGLRMEKPYQTSEALKLSEIAEGKAHLKLVRLLQDGRLDAWGEMFVQAREDLVPTQHPRALLPLEVWSERRRIRKKGSAAPKMSGPFPDYSSSTIPEITNLKNGNNEEFKNIQVNANQLEIYLKASVTLISVKAGVFRIIRKTPSKGVKSVKDLECLVQIKYADCEACLEPSLGLAAIGLLLGQPGEAMAWETLHTAAKLFRYGATHEVAIRSRNQATDAVELQPNNASDLDGTPYQIDSKAAILDGNLNTVSGTTVSITTSNEIRIMEMQLNSLKARADGYPGIRKAKMLEEIEALERHISKMKNDRRRTSGPDDGHRQAIYHEMEAALALLAVKCPALAGHLGTLHKLERRAFQTEDGRIVYNPGSEVTWVTQPLEV